MLYDISNYNPLESLAKVGFACGIHSSDIVSPRTQLDDCLFKYVDTNQRRSDILDQLMAPPRVVGLVDRVRYDADIQNRLIPHEVH